MTTAPVYIDDIIGEVVQATSDKILSTIQANEAAALGSTLIEQIRYSKSSFDELIENLLQADKSGNERFKKYPLVHLVQDVSVERGVEIGFYGASSLNILIIHQTIQTYKVEERGEKVFKPVLYPIYYEIMEQLKLSPWIMDAWQPTGEFRHRMIERTSWGRKNLQASKNILNDYVDAIEIQNLAVKFNFTNC